MAETPLPSPSYADEARIKHAEEIIEKIDEEDAKRDKRAAKVVKGNIKVKKKPAAKKVGEAILGEDLKDVVYHARELDLSRVSDMSEKQRLVYGVVEMLFCTNPGG